MLPTKYIPSELGPVVHMMLLVNVSLKLWSINIAYIYTYIFTEKMWVAFGAFWWKNVSSFWRFCKSYSHFFNKNTFELDILLTRTVNILTTNKLLKLMMLWTTGPCNLAEHFRKISIFQKYLFCSCDCSKGNNSNNSFWCLSWAELSSSYHVLHVTEAK